MGRLGSVTREEKANAVGNTSLSQAALQRPQIKSSRSAIGRERENELWGERKRVAAESCMALAAIVERGQSACRFGGPALRCQCNLRIAVVWSLASPLYAAFDPELEHRQYGEQDRRAWVRCRSSASSRPTGGKKPIVPPGNTITLRASLPTESGRFHLWGRVRNL